jgi:hypothetical protein
MMAGGRLAIGERRSVGAALAGRDGRAHRAVVPAVACAHADAPSSCDAPFLHGTAGHERVASHGAKTAASVTRWIGCGGVRNGAGSVPLDGLELNEIWAA